jgi:ABC-type Fe3+/spermidine/putrescine transport system ATPase subunit
MGVIMSVLSIARLTKTYKASGSNNGFSINSIDLDIHKGEIFALLGPSGCGKTTLLKLVAGLISSDGGSITQDGNDITNISPEARGFGMVFQQPLLFPHMSVMNNVAFGLKMKGMGKSERFKQAREVIASVGLSGYEGRLPNELSGGQQQRVALARAIITRPKLLLLDEPFSALDPEIRTEMRQLLKSIHHTYQMTMLFVTHDRDEAFELANRMAVIHEGAVLQTGSPMDIYLKPNHPFVASFIGNENIIEGNCIQEVFKSDMIEVKLNMKDDKFTGPGWLVIRPECFTIVPSQEAGQFSGKVIDVKFRQGFYQIRLQLGELTLTIVEKLQRSAAVPKTGDILFLKLDLNGIHFIPKL